MWHEDSTIGGENEQFHATFIACLSATSFSLMSMSAIVSDNFLITCEKSKTLKHCSHFFGNFYEVQTMFGYMNLNLAFMHKIEMNEIHVS